MKSNEIERNQTQFDDIKLNQLKLYQIKLNYIKLDDMKWDEIKLTTFGAEKKNWGINQKMRTVEYNSHWFHPGEWSNQTKHVTIRTQPINHSIKTTTIRKKKNCDFLISSSREKKKSAPRKRVDDEEMPVDASVQRSSSHATTTTSRVRNNSTHLFQYTCYLLCSQPAIKPVAPPSKSRENHPQTEPARCPLGARSESVATPSAARRRMPVAAFNVSSFVARCSERLPLKTHWSSSVLFSA